MEAFKTYLREKKRLRETTIASYSEGAKHFLMFNLGHTIDYERILIYIEHNREVKVTARTINHYLRSLDFYLDYLVDSKLRQDNPAKGIRVKANQRGKFYRRFTLEEIEQMYMEYPSESLKEKRDKCILGLIVFQGAAIGDLKYMEKQDVDLAKGTVHLPQTPKSNSRTLALSAAQILDLHTYVREALQEIEAIKGLKENNKLFISMGSSMKLHNLIAPITRIIARKHPKLKHLKDIRGTRISYWIQQQGVRKAQYMAGHRYVSSTQNYSLIELESLQEKLRQIHPLKD